MDAGLPLLLSHLHLVNERKFSLVYELSMGIAEVNIKSNFSYSGATESVA